ncbi:MAG: DivIVA domain-containing protein [Thermoleophilia bacterium]
MKLTPLDIRHREFKRGMRGYADVEVDEFLDEVADEYERLFKENIDLQERVETLEDQVLQYKRIEDTLQKTLVTAQSSAEEVKQNAGKQAELILHEAELKARELVNEAYTEKQGIEQAMAKLKSTEKDFRFKFRQLLEGYLKHVEEAPAAGVAAVGGTAHAEFARHAEAIKAAIAREAPAPPVPLTSPDPVAAADAPAASGVAGAPGGDDPEITAAHSRPADDEEPAGEQAAASPSEAPADEQPPAREKILFGESDDLLADVDSGVNENEFKW